MAKIIQLNTEKFSKERYERRIEKEKMEQAMNACSHKSIMVDNEQDNHVCEECKKQFTAWDYLVFIAENDLYTRPISVDLDNKMYFQRKELEEIQEKIKELKAERRAIQTWVTKNSKNVRD